MKIPKEVAVGETKVRVNKVHSLMVGKNVCRGGYDWGKKEISIASNNPSGTHKYSASEKSNTFWHELTHAILHDMGEDKLNHNEQFVSDFANRLDQAIKTARF
jgi:hypothetical protein